MPPPRAAAAAARFPSNWFADGSPGPNCLASSRPNQTVYGIFTRGARHGVWQQIHHARHDLVRVHERRHPLPTAAIIDSQSVRGADTVPGAYAGRLIVWAKKVLS